MPAGVPVATVAIGSGKNAGLLAVRILAAQDPDLRRRMDDYRQTMAEESLAKNSGLPGQE